MDYNEKQLVSSTSELKLRTEPPLAQPRTTKHGRFLAWLLCVIFGVPVLCRLTLRREPHKATGYSADPIFDWYALPSSEDIKWTPCFGETKQCARLSLPLDYLNVSHSPKTEIALLMIPATDRENYRGTILVNPGGPGGAGTHLVQSRGEALSKIVGPSYDILGFDPRGTGATTPSSRCFDSRSQYDILVSQAGPLSFNDTSIPLERSRQKLVGQRCLQELGGNGKEDPNGTAEEWGPARFMSTASVATDMLHIVEKLGQEKLQYWGFSYGSVLGQYFAAMYPDKVGRLIIDGVYDAYDYRATNWATNLVDTDAVIASFYDFCLQAGPSRCSIYEPTIDEMQSRVNKILYAIADAPIPVPYGPKGPSVFTKDIVHIIMFVATYTPLRMFPILADTLVAVENNGDRQSPAKISTPTPPLI
ncbi:hypothetical protein PLICRDRAFT_696949 [Plicaturopsis crispa FD-325 SS-3]|nr:hypothetical protein PLICRDRAFT_696949 [Plicaturopsis crispa FD-325 SS-3]